MESSPPSPSPILSPPPRGSISAPSKERKEDEPINTNTNASPSPMETLSTTPQGIVNHTLSTLHGKLEKGGGGQDDADDEEDFTQYCEPTKEYYCNAHRDVLYSRSLCSWGVHPSSSEDGTYAKHAMEFIACRPNDEIWVAAQVIIGDDYIRIISTGNQLECQLVPCRWSNDGGGNTPTLTIPDPDTVRGKYGRWHFTSMAKLEIERNWGMEMERSIRGLHLTPEGREYLRAWYPHCSSNGKLHIISKLGESFIRGAIVRPSGEDETDVDEHHIVIVRRGSFQTTL